MFATTATINRNALTSALASELYDPNIPRWKRNEERQDCRLTAEQLVKRWPPFMPYPTTRDQIRTIAKRIKADTFRPEDIAAIVAPVRI
jgi:hypothetical protein